MTTFITADQHWGHANIIKYSHRQFDTLDEHDAALISAWNEVVGENDEVYHLGDLTLGSFTFAKQILSQLNGVIKILEYPWHHDSRWIKSAGLAIEGRLVIEKPIVVLEHIFTSRSEWLPVVLCHYPFEVWDRSHYGSVHFHGHTHGTLRQAPNRLDVGVDMAFKLLGEYRPFRLTEALSLTKSQP